VKYADNLVVLAKEKMVLLNITGRLIEIVRYIGMDINVEKTEVMTISRQPFLVQIVITPKKNAECGIFNLFGYHDNK